MAELIPVENLDVVKAIVAEHREVPGCLMQILQETQLKYGYLPLELQGTIADELGIPLTEVYGVATFYSQFTLKPKGKYKIGICLGTACYVRGSQAIIDKVNSVLGTQVGDTTEDGKWSVDATRCVGACGLAPVMMINEEVFGRLTVDEIPGILEKY
ncbi:NADH-quinone oxidoreductase subunit NuoE family protein [Acetobacterium woodii]|nr:NAD(P)H-dependent oxidoreductase subunit E [Acetobacterium woodii]7Q4V_C Chain C, Iron hydrogenase HydC [Acetobacterium woodii DSM 1030]7Q4V_G Chain G, Iron hydrogenase HydC [Acetobacterium woodii DSM 1030]7Q4W_C Chain C, Iron hydrogenase HydC [Acetobacterium woodii DSM 1030]7Q4W_G Chain G, Iron hydrogenase HydC [Acetobacterium woodii DSM 1030]8A5E_C Chain C, Iron hydrogenase HydC [Acetobacterium woodii DSM 1030]